MEAVHKTSCRPWIDKEKISVSQFIQDWASVEEIRPKDTKGKKTESSFLATEELISDQKLAFDEEDIFLNNDEWTRGKIPANLELKTVKERNAFFDLLNKDKAYRRELFQSQQYMVQQSLANRGREQPESKTKAKAKNQAVLTVEVYRPLHSMRKNTEYRNQMQTVPDQVYEVISTLPLSALRDQIRCVADNRHNREVSGDPDSVTHGRDAGHVYKSGYFYINETFYNDMRCHQNLDYSETIIKWASQQGRGIGPFKKSTVTETFADLTIQLGYPYLYVHQGNCEHLLVFSDIRLIKSVDSSNLLDYPKFIHSNRRPHINCIFCKVNVAKWFVKDNDQMPEDPSFLCERCFRMFCYDTTGQKKCDFKAYPFLDKSVLI